MVDSGSHSRSGADIAKQLVNLVHKTELTEVVVILSNCKIIEAVAFFELLLLEIIIVTHQIIRVTTNLSAVFEAGDMTELVGTSVREHSDDLVVTPAVFLIESNQRATAARFWIPDSIPCNVTISQVDGS